jgi:hypothetical protein
MLCFRCGFVTETPGLPDGEILPIPLVVFGPVGIFRVNSTVPIAHGAVYTSDEEIGREQSLTRPRKPVSQRKNIPDILSEVEAHYNELTGGQVAKHAASVRRGFSNANPLRGEFPLPSHLQILDQGVHADLFLIFV